MYRFSIFSFFIFSCSSGIYADFQTINTSWKEDHEVVFNLPNVDVKDPFELLISLRNSNEYPFSNLFLIVQMTHPDGFKEVDTLEYQMTEPDGRWLGVGVGNIKDNLFSYREQMIFSKTGNYILSIQHALRNVDEAKGLSELKGIIEIGYQMRPILK